MQHPELSRQLQKLNSLFEATSDVANGDANIQAHWARYLCVLSAGFIENALKEIYIAFAKKSASPQVSNYATSMLNTIQNPKANKFYEITNSFNRDWGNSLKDYMEEDGRGEAITSIMSNRHLIAHGKDTSITMSTLREYLKKSVQVIEFVEKQCG